MPRLALRDQGLPCTEFSETRLHKKSRLSTFFWVWVWAGPPIPKSGDIVAYVRGLPQ